MATVHARRLALVLSSRFVEVYAPGLGSGPYHRREFEPTEVPAELAEQALAALRDSGERRRHAVLFLEDELLTSQQLRLPPVPASEVREVLRRQLERDVEGSLHFLAEGPADDVASEDPWRATCVGARFHRELLLALREQGVEILATHALDLALLAVSRDELETEQVQASVIFGHERVLVALQSNAATHQLAVLPTRSEHGAEDIAIRVTQELRGLAAYWRKASRGGELDLWRTFGANAEQRAALEGGALSALGGVEGRHREAEAPREDLLAAALGRSANDLDLAPGLVPRRRRVGLASALATAGLVSLLALQLPQWRERLIENEGRLSQASVEERELARLSAQRAALESARGEFESELQRLSELAARGIDLDAVLIGCAAALKGRAQLLGLEAGLGEQGRSVLLNAVLPLGQGIDAAALQAMRADLEALPFLEGVEVVLSAQLPTELNDVPHAFEVRAQLAEVQS
ncbi:MAG: hypothetical protein ACYS26_08530 [Planctomycetota bacterium]|jgi:hypothetical protein